MGYKTVDSDAFESNCCYCDLGYSKRVRLSLQFTFDFVSVSNEGGFVVDVCEVERLLNSWYVSNGDFCGIYFDFSNLKMDFSGCLAKRVSFSLGDLFTSLDSTKLLPVYDSNDMGLVDVEFCLDMDSTSFVFNFYFIR